MTKEEDECAACQIFDGPSRRKIWGPSFGKKGACAFCFSSSLLPSFDDMGVWVCGWSGEMGRGKVGSSSCSFPLSKSTLAPTSTRGQWLFPQQFIASRLLKEGKNSEHPPIFQRCSDSDSALPAPYHIISITSSGVWDLGFGFRPFLSSLLVLLTSTLSSRFLSS